MKLDAQEILGDLLKSLEAAPQKVETKPLSPQRPKNTGDGRYVQKSGVGGIIMNFGHSSGNQFVDNWNNILQKNSDHTQAQTATYQRDSFQKALGDYVDLGEHEYAQKMRIEEQQQGEKNHIAHEEIKKAYEHTRINVGGKSIVATSETDKAIMEMFANNQLED